MKEVTCNKLNIWAESAIDFHCHGIGSYDFTDIGNLNLHDINSILATRKHHTILTLYLPQHNFNNFLELVDSYYQAQQQGAYPYIMGISLEGPLLASHGGTPEIGVWNPTKQQWQDIAACGKKGLVYVILSPDADLSSGSDDDPHLPPKTISWIAETLLEGGVLPAPGHFTKHNPQNSAQCLQNLFDVVAAWGKGFTVTDHLYNDMPLNFKHAWRTPEERLHKAHDLAELQLSSWNINNLEEKLGCVPATIIRNAHKGYVKIAQNFDGEHVDLAIVKRTVELVGAQHMLMMTDSIENHRLAGRALYRQPDSALLYQAQGIVAAGGQNIARQINNMIITGFDDEQIELMTHHVPQQVLKQHHQYCCVK